MAADADTDADADASNPVVDGRPLSSPANQSSSPEGRTEFLVLLTPAVAILLDFDMSEWSMTYTCQEPGLGIAALSKRRSTSTSSTCYLAYPCRS